MAKEELGKTGNCLFEQRKGPERRADFAVAGKKSPIHMSKYAPLSIVGTNTIFYSKHLTTDVDVST